MRQSQCGDFLLCVASPPKVCKRLKVMLELVPIFLLLSAKLKARVIFGKLFLQTDDDLL